MPDDTHINLQQTVAVLRQELETRTIERDDALARQSATSEILSVLSRSPSDIRPVFEAIVARGAIVRGQAQLGVPVRGRAAVPCGGPQPVAGGGRGGSQRLPATTRPEFYRRPRLSRHPAGADRGRAG